MVLPWVLFLCCLDPQKVHSANGSEEPEIINYLITTKVQHRYVRTEIDCIVQNNNKHTSKEFKLELAIPSTAFVTQISIRNDIPGHEFKKAIILEKNTAKNIYKKSSQQNISTVLVATSDIILRDSENIGVSLNLPKKGENGSAVQVKLEYEYLLIRRSSRYKLNIPIMPLKKIVALMKNPGTEMDRKFSMKVGIDENLPLRKITSSSRTKDYLDVELVIISKESEFTDDTNRLKKSCPKNFWNLEPHNGKAELTLSKAINEIINSSSIDWNLIEGLELHVDYDIERKQEDSHIQTFGRYFMHAFSPLSLDRLPRHVIFTLDKSGSMWNGKMTQVKDAMVEILRDLTHKVDKFNIVTFNGEIEEWHPIQIRRENARYERRNNCTNKITPEPYEVNKKNIKDAQDFVFRLKANGLTNIKSALKTSMQLAELSTSMEQVATNSQPMVIFMTDGCHYYPGSNSSTILPEVQSLADNFSIPIFALGFGKSADVELLKNLSQITGGRFKMIYDDPDATAQLSNYYTEISSPVLNSLAITYIGDSFEIVSSDIFGLYYRGEEKIVIGKFAKRQPNSTDDFHKIVIVGSGINGSVIYHKTIELCKQKNDSNSTILFPKLPALNVSTSTTMHLLNKSVTNSPPNITDTKVSTALCFNTSKTIDPSETQAHADEMQQAEDFLERVWAFTKIKDYLAQPEKGTGNKKEALELSLKYKFVTPLTSLVFSTDANFSANYLQSTANPKQQQNQSDPSPSYPDVFLDVSSSADVTELLLDNENCSIEIFPETYFRSITADSLRFTSPVISIMRNVTTTNRLEIPSLYDYGFDNTMLSFKLEGRCCWQFYQGSYFTGQNKTTEYKKKLYNSATWLGSTLAGQVSSLKVTQCKIKY